MYTDLTTADYQSQFASGDSGDYQLIDVREDDEYAAGRLPGAINIPLSEFMARADEINEDSPALLVCNTGVRSSQAAMYLYSLGYERLYNLEDGTKGWLNDGLPVERE